MRTYEDIDLMVLRNDIEGLMKAAKDADETIRERAVKALRAINPDEAREVLRQAQSDSSAKVRRAASGVTLGDASLREKTSVQTPIEDKVEENKISIRWLWIMIGTWGVGSLLLALLILVLMFSGGNFGNSAQIIGVLVLGVPGIVMLWVAVKKLREGGQK
ncbi:MAG: HEAT repeat domain-containing protein [Erysipelotrichaceae bacterium]|nr:HEAT repeat domain-containing protein [Erysipelotrichaceae bacterium]